MKRLATILLSTTLMASVVFADSDPVVATYKGGQAKASQVMEQFKPAFEAQPQLKGKTFSELDKNVQEQLVRGYVNSQLLDQAVKDSKITSSKEFQAKVATATQQMSQQELIEGHLKTAVTPDKIHAEYEKYAQSLKGQKEVKASHILVATEEEAKKIKAELDKGAKFATLVKKSSKDEGSKSTGGSLGYFVKGQLVPEFEAKAFSMKPGEVSSPVKTQFGWHVIKVEDKRDAKVASEEEAKPNITSKLNRDAVEAYIKDLNVKSDVKILVDKVEDKK